MEPNKYNVVPIELMRGESDEETLELEEMFARARSFVSDFKWCRSIEGGYFGYGVGGILAVFLFKIAPSSSEVDSSLWVIIGDIPPAYITTEGNPTWRDALEGYIREMERWVLAIEESEPTDELIPVNTSPTIENAKLLKSRLDFIKKEMLS